MGIESHIFFTFLNTNILRTDVQDFINSNLKSDITKLIFKGSPFEDISIQELANQIISKQKSQKKLPTWFHTKSIYFPPKISIEQTSSETTAEFKASLVKGKSIADISGGFGVDTFYFSKSFDEVFHCEINNELSDIVNHNLKTLNCENITSLNENGIDFIANYVGKLDCIYIDPSRRDEHKNKVFLLEDCSPNVPKNLDLLFSKSNQILIKTSPLLDISSAVNELNHVKKVFVVAVENDVKELLFILENGFQGQITIETVNITKTNTQKFSFTAGNSIIPEYSLPLNFLYEPNAAILKSGAFNEIATQFNLKKLHVNTHLYTSEELVDNFPGRGFQVLKTIPYNKKTIAKVLPEKKANITVRNFPKTVDQIRKETKIKTGGDTYIFCTKTVNDSNILIINTKTK